MQNTRFRRLWALIVKEFFQIVRDPSSILISVVLPILLLFLYGFGVSLDLDHLRLGLVLEDTSPTAIEFAESIMNSPFFDITLARDRREILDDLEEGNLRGFVVIPAYFTQFEKRRKIAPILVVADGSEPNTASFVQNYVQGAYQNWQQQREVSQRIPSSVLVRSSSRFWYNEELRSRYFLMPGSLAIIMTLIGTLLTALVVSREWERGTMESLLSTPVTKMELIFGKLIPYFLLGMVSMIINVVVCIAFYGLPLRGSIFVLFLVSSAFLFCALSFGLMISTMAKNQIIASQIALVAGFLPSYMLSGFLFEISSMPIVIQWITYLIPAKYFVQALQTLFLVGNVWSLILWNTFAMLVIGLIFFFITLLKTEKRLE